MAEMARPFPRRETRGVMESYKQEAKLHGFLLAWQGLAAVGRGPGMVLGCLLRVRGLPSGIDSEMVLSSVSRCRKGMILICFLWIRKRLTI